MFFVLSVTVNERFQSTVRPDLEFMCNRATSSSMTEVIDTLITLFPVFVRTASIAFSTWKMQSVKEKESAVTKIAALLIL